MTNIASGANQRFKKDNSADEEIAANEEVAAPSPPPTSPAENKAPVSSPRKKIGLNDLKAKLKRLKADDTESDALLKIEDELRQMAEQFGKKLNKIEEQRIKAARRQIHMKEQEVIKYLKRCGLTVPKSGPIFRKVMENLDNGDINAPIIFEIKNRKLTIGQGNG